MPRSKISDAELATIVDHLDDMIDACVTALELQRAIPKKDRNILIEGQIRYWKNLVSGYKWAKQIAYQRGGHLHGERRGDIKQARVNLKPGGGDIRGLLAKAKDFGVRHAESLRQEIRASGARYVGGNLESINGRTDSGIDDESKLSQGGDRPGSVTD